MILLLSRLASTTNKSSCILVVAIFNPAGRGRNGDENIRALQTRDRSGLRPLVSFYHFLPSKRASSKGRENRNVSGFCPQTLAFAPNVEHWDMRSLDKPLLIWPTSRRSCNTNLRSDRQISKMKSRSQTRIGRIRLVPLNADWYERCIDRFTFWHLLKVLIFPLRGRRKVRQTLCNYSHKHIITLRSKKEVKDFLAQLEQDVDIKRNSSHVVTVRRERNLAIRLILTIYYFLARKSARTTTLLSRYSVEYKMDEHSME